MGRLRRPSSSDSSDCVAEARSSRCEARKGRAGTVSVEGPTVREGEAEGSGETMRFSARKDKLPMCSLEFLREQEEGEVEEAEDGDVASGKKVR